MSLRSDRSGARMDTTTSPADGAPTPSFCVHCGWPGPEIPDDHLHPVAYECKACRRAARDAEHDPLTGAPVAQREATL